MVKMLFCWPWLDRPCVWEQAPGKRAATAGETGAEGMDGLMDGCWVLWGKSNTWALGEVTGSTCLKWGRIKPSCLQWGLTSRGLGAAAWEEGFRYVSSNSNSIKARGKSFSSGLSLFTIGPLLALFVTVLGGGESSCRCPGQYGLGGEL